MVWVDAPRQPAAEAFKTAYPDIPIEINAIPGNVGSTDLQQKFALFNQAGKGWPDAIFFPSNDDIAWATSAKINYARDLKPIMGDYLKGYTEANNAPCNIDDQVRCARNDSAPDVFWYNKKLFDEWGYKPPTTWEEYADLGIKIATEHPGYISGFLGDAYAPDRYLWASGCPTNDRLSETKVHINTSDPNCKRVVDLIDKMVAAKALSAVGIFDPNAAEVGPKLAMSPGAVWWGNYLFRDTWKIPAGQMTATAPIHWAAETPGFTGDEGGGLWGVSSHIKGKQLENTQKFIEVRDERPALAGRPVHRPPGLHGSPAGLARQGGQGRLLRGLPDHRGRDGRRGQRGPAQPLLHALQHRRHLEQDRDAGPHRGQEPERRLGCLRHAAGQRGQDLRVRGHDTGN